MPTWESCRRPILWSTIYIAMALGAFGVAIEFYYMSAYIERRAAPGANELLEGVAYATLIFGALWIGAPLAALVGKFWLKLSSFNIAISSIPLIAAVAIWNWPKFT